MSKAIQTAISQANEIILETKDTNNFSANLVKLSADVNTSIKETRELLNNLYSKVQTEIRRKWDKVPFIGKILAKIHGNVFDRALSVDELISTVLGKISEYEEKLKSYKETSLQMFQFIETQRKQAKNFTKKYSKTYERISKDPIVKDDYIKIQETKKFLKFYQTIKTIESILLQLRKQNLVVLESLDSILTELATTKAITKNVLMTTLTQLAIQVTQKEALELIQDTRNLHELALEGSVALSEENFEILKKLDQETFIKVSVIKTLLEKLETLSEKYKALEKESIKTYKKNIQDLNKVLDKFERNVDSNFIETNIE